MDGVNAKMGCRQKYMLSHSPLNLEAWPVLWMKQDHAIHALVIVNVQAPCASTDNAAKSSILCVHHATTTVTVPGVLNMPVNKLMENVNATTPLCTPMVNVDPLGMFRENRCMRLSANGTSTRLVSRLVSKQGYAIKKCPWRLDMILNIISSSMA